MMENTQLRRGLIRNFCVSRLFELLQNKLVMTSYLQDGHGKTVSDITDACVKMSADGVILLQQMCAQLHLYIFSLDIFVKSESWSGCW